MTFSPQALAEAAERGGKYTCPACGAKCLFYVIPGVENGMRRRPWCPSCRDVVEYEKWIPRQPRLPLEV